MTSSPPNAAGLLNWHSGFVMASAQVAGGFFAVYLLKAGLSLALTFGAIGAVLAVRFQLRFLVLWLVPKLGLRQSLALGTAVRAAQFVPLAYATHLYGLLAWIALLALSDALYWPLYHTLVAGIGEPASRGKQVGTLEVIRSITGIAGPALGGWLLAGSGPVATFTLGAALQLAALWPLWVMAEIPTGPVPSWRRSLEGDRLGFTLFVADGVIQIGWYFAWPMALFLTLHADFAAYGGAMALAGLVAAFLSFTAGRAIDRGHGIRLLVLVAGLVAGGTILRIVALGDETQAVAVNAFSVVAMALYTPLLMNTMYNRAHRLGPLGFHFFTESGWDLGGIIGCCLAAAIAAAGASLAYAMLPAFLGITVICRMVIAAEREARGVALTAVQVAQPGAGAAHPQRRFQ
jgi:MFS transporter, DHA1 family, inner membrane transport protein